MHFKQILRALQLESDTQAESFQTRGPSKSNLFLCLTRTRSSLCLSLSLCIRKASPQQFLLNHS